MAQPGSIEFDPPRTPNRTRARSRFLFDERIGAWAMEILHNVTDIGDYYNGVLHPGRFDEMADSVATHPSSYTKIVAGWLDPFEVATHPGGRHRYTLHAIGLPHPSPAGRVACVKVQTLGSERYLIIEARLKSDRWDRGFSGSKGIKSEGVVVYEFSPETNPWPRVHPNGPWPPLELRTPTALTEGQSFTHADTGTTITVFAAVAGFVIEVTTDDITVPDVRELRATVAAARIRAAGLQPKFIGTPGSQAWVRSQSPKAGTGAPPGSIVTLNLSSGPIP
ncbi:MAG TPA: PASTA domain-containing protein [Pyrinomonadaceae bacterium]|nr:PASTA domain-containing protein [Pyrinomonadaceae bacterium]